MVAITRAPNPDRSFWAGKRVLVTGHTGFKGAWLMLWLERLGAIVTGLVLPPSTSPNLFALTSPGRDSHIVDVRDLSALRDHVLGAEPDIIFHLAAQALVRASYADPVGTYATNVMGTVHLLEAARESGARAVVVVTSDKVYANREWHWGYRETDALGGHDPYSNSKGCCELVVDSYRSSFFGADRARVASARAGNVVGGGDWSCDRLIPDIARAVEQRRSVEIRSPGAVRPWQHVLEPLSGYLLLAERLHQPQGVTFATAWNFGPSEEDCRPVAEVVEFVINRFGDGASWHLSEKQHVHEATFLKVDSAKAQAQLRWNRRLNLETALSWTIDWYRDQKQGADVRALTDAQIAAYEGLGV